MSIGFFIVGGIIFAVYMYFTIWNIFYSSRESKRANYPNLGSEGCDLPETVNERSENIFIKSKNAENAA